MLPSLDNFISYGSDIIKQRPDYKGMILDIYTTAMRSEQLGEADRVNACKLIESFLLNLRGDVDDALRPVIEQSLQLLDTEATLALRMANLGTLVNAVLYNPGAALQIMESTKLGVARTFFEKWFEALKAEKGFCRVHDLKLSIMTMCALLEVDASVIPASLQEGWTTIVSAALEVFKRLPQAVESKSWMCQCTRSLTLSVQSVRKLRMPSGKKKKKTLTLMLASQSTLRMMMVSRPPSICFRRSLILFLDNDVWDEDSEYIEMLAKEVNPAPMSFSPFVHAQCRVPASVRNRPVEGPQARKTAMMKKTIMMTISMRSSVSSARSRMSTLTMRLNELSKVPSLLLL